ncbi:MAG: translation initiation factor eIF-2B, partial [Chloroflexota bacterium]|nr:translation initiation factor eIF-2B [Chloroflexota bacterium]
MSAVSADISEAIEAISQDRAHGAGWLAREAVNVLVQSLQDCRARTGEEFLSYLREVGQALARAQPSMAAVSNAVGAVVLAAAGKAGAGSLSATRRAAVVRARQIIASWDKAVSRIIHYAERTVPPKAGILTHSYSATALAVLEHLGSQGASVIATESAPLYEGRATARHLARLGVGVTLISDAQAGSFVSRASAVLVGADTVFANGAVVNKVGTYTLALLAGKAHVPFYVATETLKVASTRPTSGFGREAGWEAGGDDLVGAIPAVYFDLTPPRLVTALITEQGVFRPREIRPLAIRARQYRTALFP